MAAIFVPLQCRRLLLKSSGSQETELLEPTLLLLSEALHHGIGIFAGGNTVSENPWANDRTGQQHDAENLCIHRFIRITNQVSTDSFHQRVPIRIAVSNVAGRYELFNPQLDQFRVLQHEARDVVDTLVLRGVELDSFRQLCRIPVFYTPEQRFTAVEVVVHRGAVET